jgi:hypothetical protein
MRKTPIPTELLLEPPKLDTRLVSVPAIGKILIRDYGTASRAERFKAAYNSNKKEFWGGAVLGFATLLY